MVLLGTGLATGGFVLPVCDRDWPVGVLAVLFIRAEGGGLLVLCW